MKIGDLFVKLGLQKGEFDKGLDDAKKQTGVFGSSIKKLGGLIAGVFAADKIIQFGEEVFKIATEAEGVRSAFMKIANETDLDNLRKSVKGTVSDLQLMKRSVIASNFGIPIQQLGNLFEFASKRAQDTGQSIDYLVDSIVIGIGRKSPLILDNLGISIVELRERMGGLSAETASVGELTKVIGDIANDALTRSGRLADTLGTKVQSLGASWDNFKLSLSELFSESGFLKETLDGATTMLQIWANKNVSFLTKVFAGLNIPGFSLKAAQDIINAKPVLNPESEGGPLDKKNERTLMQRIKDLEFLIAVEKKLATQKGISAKEALTHAEEIKKAEDELKQLREIAGIAAHKTYKQQLDDIIAKNKALEEEKEAQRILRMEFYGEKMTEITPIGTPDQLQSTPIDTNSFTDMSNYLKSVSGKREKWTEEEKKSWQDFTDDLNNTIKEGLIDAVSTMAAGFGEMLAMDDWDWKDFGNKILDSIGRFLQTFGSLMVTMGIGMLQIDLGMKTWNPGLLIAGGAVMIAAGAAISALSKGGVNKSTGGASSAASGYRNYSQSNAQMALSGNVVFELQGDKLKGVLNNTDRKNRYIR